PLMKAPKKVNMDLVKYIEEGLRRGFDIGLLKDKLVGAGFSKNDVEIAAGFVGERKSKRTSLVVKNNLVGKPVEKISKSPNKLEEKHRGILERFFHPKNPELAKIKDEVENGGQEDKKDSVKELIAPVKEHGNIESMDDLNRVRRRIEQKQKDLARKGYKGAELTRVD
ncbi:MAG: hypothetical protein KC506_03425, partial [Nanoarchaeota archaeon]|nr:hypothetical protein [Nanoarchaeota archaeon]